MRILVTGGTGFIGSHTVVELLKEEHEVIIVDNFSNSNSQVLESIEKTVKNETNKKSFEKVIIYKEDIQNQAILLKIFKKEKPEIVIHFAGFKSVRESLENPLSYFKNNVLGSIILFDVMKETGVDKIIFSSSATVYGEQKPPFTEIMERGKITNPYGKTKAMIEEILLTLDIDSVILRYFNPIGAHPLGFLKENPQTKPNNLMPFIIKAASNNEILKIFGNDYPTPDGTCQRDFIHICDLVSGHIAAINFLVKNKGINIFNLGTGNPVSVYELINCFEKTNNIKLKFEFVGRRDGDVAVSFASCEKANKILFWNAKKNIKDMCKDSWNSFKQELF